MKQHTDELQMKLMAQKKLESRNAEDSVVHMHGYLKQWIGSKLDCGK